jgi:hypothetical protein
MTNCLLCTAKVQHEDEAVIKALRSVLAPRLDDSAGRLFHQLVSDLWPNHEVPLGFNGRKLSAMSGAGANQRVTSSAADVAGAGGVVKRRTDSAAASIAAMAPAAPPKIVISPVDMGFTKNFRGQLS